tara:strand:- start:468 stop:2075 length:1608 start_codon:yes stop_codon:yes gene_type:complete
MKDENRAKGSYSLETLLCSEMNVEPWKADTDFIIKQTGDAADWSPPQRAERCRLDAWASYLVAARFQNAAPPPLREFTHRTAMTLHRMYLAGAAVDLSRFHELGKGWRAEATKARDIVTKAAHAAGMDAFSPTDDEDLRAFVYEKLGCPVTKTTEKLGKPKVDKMTLEQFTTEHPIITSLIDFNRADKLAGTWYGPDDPDKTPARPPLKDTIVEVRPGVGRLQFRINPLGARTGRRSSGGGVGDTPDANSRNSQNWPKIARSMIRSRWDGGKIGAFDYARLEVVLMGWITGDDKLLEYFTTGEGYIGAARDIMGKEVEKDTEQYRVVKSIILGTNYNMKKWKLAHDLWYRAGVQLNSDFKKHIALAGDLREKYLNTFPGVRRYIQARLNEMGMEEQVKSPAGRVRHLPHHGPNTEGYWHLQNQAVNFPVQSFASDVTASALMDAESAILAEHGVNLLDWHAMLIETPTDLPCSVLFNEVHDELTCDLHPDTWEVDSNIIMECMKNVVSLRQFVPRFDVPLIAEATIGPRWGVEGE